MTVTVNPGVGVLPATRGQVPGPRRAPGSILHPTGSFSHAVGLTQEPETAVPPIPSAPLNITQAPVSVPAAIPRMHIQPPAPPPTLSPTQAQRPQSVTVIDGHSHNSFLVQRQHYRPTSVPISIFHPNNSPPATPFTQHTISVPSCAALTQPCQYTHNHPQWDINGHACPQMHRQLQVHQAQLMDIPTPLEGHLFSWTARRQGDGGINASLDEALDDFIAGVDAEMKGGWALMPPDPSFGGHWPGRYVEESGAGRGIIVEWMKRQ